MRAAVGPADVWISATHTHAGPETGCAPGGAATPAPWLDRITELAVDAAARATAAATVATVEVRTTRVTCVGGLRSGPRPGRSVPVDVLTVHDGGRVTGAIVVLPVHPTVLDAENRLVSADLAGAVRTALAAELNGAWVVVATGAAGDVSTRPFRREQTPAECARLGALVADAVVEALRGCRRDRPGRGRPARGGHPGRPGTQTVRVGRPDRDARGRARRRAAHR